MPTDLVLPDLVGFVGVTQPQQLVWPNHCSHTGKWLPLSPFCTLLHHLCAASGLASCHMTSKRTQGCPWWWHRCHVMITAAVTAKHPVCVCECVIGITTRLLCYSATHLTFIHHPSFLPSLPDSPLIEIYYPHPATGPQCQSDHTLCSRNGHTNHSLMQTVRYIWFGRCVIWNHFILELMDLLFVKMTMFMMRTVSGWWWWGFEAQAGRF